MARASTSRPWGSASDAATWGCCSSSRGCRTPAGCSRSSPRPDAAPRWRCGSRSPPRRSPSLLRADPGSTSTGDLRSPPDGGINGRRPTVGSVLPARRWDQWSASRPPGSVRSTEGSYARSKSLRLSLLTPSPSVIVARCGDQALADGDRHRLQLGVGPELADDALDVVAQRVDADEEALADLFVAHPIGEEEQHRGLSRGERLGQA